MTTEEYAWRRYADLQQRSSKIQTIDDYAWGVDSALMFLINAIQTSSLPSNPVELDLALKRVISSGARLRRSRDAALKKWMTPPDSMVTSTAAEANVELSRIAAVTTGSDQKILFDAGFGYTDREIAHRHRSTREQFAFACRGFVRSWAGRDSQLAGPSTARGLPLFVP